MEMTIDQRDHIPHRHFRRIGDIHSQLIHADPSGHREKLVFHPHPSPAAGKISGITIAITHRHDGDTTFPFCCETSPIANLGALIHLAYEDDPGL